MIDFIEINSDTCPMTFKEPTVFIPIEVRQLGIAKIVQVRTKSNGGVK